MKIEEEFNRDIQGERLLYENKESYTKEESELIVKTVAKRISKNYYYASLIKKLMPTLLEKVLPNIEEGELTDEKATIAVD